MLTEKQKKYNEDKQKRNVVGVMSLQISLVSILAVTNFGLHFGCMLQ